jgi:hypothetical protein
VYHAVHISQLATACEICGLEDVDAYFRGALAELLRDRCVRHQPADWMESQTLHDSLLCGSAASRVVQLHLGAHNRQVQDSYQ